MSSVMSRCRIGAKSMSDAIVTKSYFDDAQVAFQVWNLSNELLYKLCLEYPSHDADDVIAAKTWLIGRSYAVSLERRSGMSDLDAFYVERVIPTLKSSKLDYHSQKFRGFKPKEPLPHSHCTTISCVIYARSVIRTRIGDPSCRNIFIFIVPTTFLFMTVAPSAASNA